MDARLRSWLHGLEAWLARAKTTATDPEEVLEAPPDAIVAQLAQAMGALSPPSSYRETVRTRLAEAIDGWRSQRDAENSLVFLSSPVEPLEPILQASLTNWQHDMVTLVQPLPGCRRLDDPLALQAQLYNAFDPEKAVPSGQQDGEDDREGYPRDDTLSDRYTVIVVPALETFFLRCIQGWEGIEYLQNLVVQDRSRFWVFGCNHWGWAFLDRVCQISAYLEQVESLPKLSGEELQVWLGPLLLQFSEDDAPDQEKSVAAEEAADDAPEIGSHASWNALAGLAGGTASVAAQLWLSSLRVKAEEVAALTEDGALEAENLTVLKAGSQDLDERSLALHLSKPILPSLPSLTILDRYLLHSLLIHGFLSRQQLALSLGEAENQVRSRVQVLRRAGVIIQQGDWLAVHPTHYPKLRGELSNNNFLIGQE